MSTDFEYRLRVRTSSTDFEYGLRVRTSKDKDTYGYIYVHMDTHGYIKWIHMGAQEPGCGTKLAAGPWGGGGWARVPWALALSRVPWALALSMGPGPGPVQGPRAPPPVLCHSLALGPPYVSIICIHVCPYVHRCIHMYAYVCF